MAAAARRPKYPRVRLVGETRRRVKDLPGFRKTHRVPDRVDAATTRFLHELVAHDLKADVDAVFAALRAAFGYTRRQVKTAHEGGLAALRTPDFDYTVSAALAADDAATLVVRREVTRMKSADLLNDPRFRTVFARSFQAIAVEPSKRVNVARWIDRVEALDEPGVTLRYPADTEWCELEMAGFGGIVRVEPAKFEVRTKGVLARLDLFETYEAFVALFRHSDLKMLG